MSVTAGVIGCGNISRFHFSGLEKAGARIKWVCDQKREAAEPWAQKLDARFAADYGEVLADVEVDVVVVTTDSCSHKSICLAAIDAGKAVICEKTLATNAEDALEIVRRAERNKTVFYTSYMKRFIPAVVQARQLLPSLGRICSTHVRAHQPWGLSWDNVGPDTPRFHAGPDGTSEVGRRYGGGILVCGGSHILDLVCFLLGRPSRIYAAMHTPAGTDCDLYAGALLETPNGVVHCDALAHSSGGIGFLRDGWDERVEINGQHGRIEIYSSLWDDVDHKASMLVHYDTGANTAREYRYPPTSPFDRAIAFFCENIAAGRQGEQSRLTGYDVDELIAHVKQSAGESRAVDVQYRI